MMIVVLDPPKTANSQQQVTTIRLVMAKILGDVDGTHVYTCHNDARWLIVVPRCVIDDD